MTRILSIYVLSGALAVLVVAVPSSADAIEIKTPQVAMPHVNVPHVTTPQVNTHVITPQVKLHVIPPEGSTGSKITDTNSGAGTPTSTGPSGGAVWQGPVTINGPSGAGAEVRSETVGGTPVAIDGPHLLGSGNNPNSGGGSLLQPVVVNHQLPKGGTGLHLPP